MHSNISIDAVGNGGYGVCRIDGQVCFVPYALPGDVVDLSIVRETKRVLWGRIERILEPSPDRIEPDCPVFGECGGCSWLHFAYPAQAEWKRRIVSDCFERIAGLEVWPDWADDPARRLGYRTRAEFHCDGQNWGFFRTGSREVVDVAACPLCHPKLNAALARLRTLKLRGSVELVVNPEGEEVLAWTKRPHRKLRNTFPLTNTPKDTKRHAFLFDGVPVVNGAFSQSSLLLNRVLREVVYQAIEAAVADAPPPETGSESPSEAASAAPPRVLDLFCGSGNLSLDLCQIADVTGLDHNRAAVRAAKTLASDSYHVGRESAFRDALGNHTWDVVLLDPPRTGAKALAADLAQAEARAIIYVSCDPATLARDVKTLAAEGWRVESMTAVDLFPHTPHVESVCRLGR